jgi:hypothetical protein
MKNTIVVKGKGIKSEFLCKEDIYPGMLVELTAENDVIKLQKNTNANNLKETCFVTEYEAFGKTILDKAAAGDTAHVYFANAGDIIYARVDSGVAVGDKLVSNGSGLLKEVNVANAVGTSTAITTGTTNADVANGLTISNYGVTAIALDNAEEVENGIYFARVIIL